MHGQRLSNITLSLFFAPSIFARIYNHFKFDLNKYNCLKYAEIVTKAYYTNWHRKSNTFPRGNYVEDMFRDHYQFPAESHFTSLLIKAAF